MMAALIWGLVQFFSTFLVPSKGFPCILIAYIYKNFWHSLAINLSGTLVSIATGFWLTRKIFHKKFTKTFKNDVRFRAVEEFVKETPWTFSAFMWFTWLPLPPKIFIYPLTQITFLQYTVSGSLVLGIGVLISTMIGHTLDNLMVLLNHDWAGTPFFLKLELLLTLVELMVTLGLFWVYGVRYKGKVERLRGEKVGKGERGRGSGRLREGGVDLQYGEKDALVGGGRREEREGGELEDSDPGFGGF